MSSSAGNDRRKRTRGNPWTGLERKNRQNERADGQREAQGDYPQRDSGQHTRQRPTCGFVQQPAFQRQNWSPALAATQVGKTLRGATRLAKIDEPEMLLAG
jgi:hypothetical protein